MTMSIPQAVSNFEIGIADRDVIVFGVVDRLERHDLVDIWPPHCVRDTGAELWAAIAERHLDVRRRIEMEFVRRSGFLIA